ncbi:MAG: hypothetical protein JWN04_693 [Myxococcaceae bacterium]|nr:hypothetical protein [Myxococcaceae bacterium]
MSAERTGPVNCSNGAHERVSQKSKRALGPVSRVRRSRPAWLGWSALVLLATPLARAQPSESQPALPTPAASASGAEGGSPAPLAAECVGDRFISLVATGLDPALSAEVRTDFAAELAHRGLALCDSTSTGRGAAAVVEAQARDGVVVIELDDRVTHKRVARDLSLAGIPENGRALAIAIAIDELLRASWAELQLARSRDVEEDEDDSTYRVAETRPVNARGRARDERTRYQVGVDVDFLHTAHNFDAFALDLRGSMRPWGWGWFELSLGGLGSVPTHSAQGDVLALGFRSALTGGACARSRARVFGCGGVRAEVDALRLRGLRPENARARSETAAVVQSSLVGLLAVTLQRNSYLFGELGLGAVLQGAAATNGDRTLLGVTGLIVSLSIGVGYEL